MSDDPPSATSTPPTSLLGAAVRTIKTRRQQLSSHTPEVEGLLTELTDDVGTLAAQEGWEPALAAGMADWATDRGTVFRALRRAHFDEAKAHSALLACCAARIEHGLCGAIPSLPVPGLFAMLPLSQTDRLGHPIAVLTVRQVIRDENGTLTELKDWLWFALEMVRRVLADYWVAHRRGTGAEGAVLLIDVKDAGYRNLEVELFPTLFSVGRNSFPGLFESVYIVNAGWSHRAMWNSVIKRLLPKSAIDKVAFLEGKEQTAEVFNLDQLPEASIADVFYTAPPSPTRSRSTSRSNSSHALVGLSAKLAMTKQGEDRNILDDNQKPTVDPSGNAIHRIKSLSNFHLYLSPSRLAHRDLLSDSEDDEPASQKQIIQTRRTLRPAMLELGASTIAARRASRTGTPATGRAATPAEYASMLQDHHARGLEQYYSPEQYEAIEAMSSPEHSDGPESPQTLIIEPGFPEPGKTECTPEILAPIPVRPGPAEAEAPDVQFSSSNPWFGYPVVRVPRASGDGYAIRPRYGRNRKRDLIKTLLWLFVLRLQTLRSSVERALGLPRLTALFAAKKPEEHATPDQGLRAVACTQSYAPKGTIAKRGGDWIWMVIGFLLFRGTWTRLVGGPLESMGLGVVRDMLGSLV
ncbi:hypothetical protein CspeluHIS016_0302320 [Cutaneotrichosporon spelunceum]|uniref:CRAL-TRIO domain-containing protein n=1 Tax=Cutaneotrichosporon spelunceum TaxID=1672016 RepID=A0AAD3YBY4_9TREE|nr:hypothetical protein CspeluHIS016_0302320 [Cutaneotrichosporon spelunceum]